MSYITWGPDLELGCVQIDSQHRSLVRILNDLYDAKQMTNINPLIVSLTLDNLIEYAAFHFETEEQYMSKGAFEPSDTHKQAHRAFEKQVMAFKFQFDQGKVDDVSEALFQFLADWLINHIQKTDKELVNFIKENKLDDYFSLGETKGG